LLNVKHQKLSARNSRSFVVAAKVLRARKFQKKKNKKKRVSHKESLVPQRHNIARKGKIINVPPPCQPQ